MERNLLKIVIVFSVIAGIKTQDVDVCMGLKHGNLTPVKDDCTRFHKCPSVHPNICPDDLYFSEAEQNCVRSNEHCLDETTTLITETDSPIHEDCKDKENSDYIIFFPSKTDCAR